MSKREARQYGRERKKRIGGRWYLIQLNGDKSFVAVHQRFIDSHKENPHFKIKEEL